MFEEINVHSSFFSFKKFTKCLTNDSLSIVVSLITYVLDGDVNSNKEVSL
ncbi:hypothetical protein AusDCA_1552 [Desulfitobacterium sp. AusDCA]